MTWQLSFVLGLFLVLAIMMCSGKFAISTCAMLCAVTLQISGILTFKEVWAGLSNSSVVMMSGMFIVGEGLGRTSLLKKISRAIIKDGSSDRKIMAGLFLITFALTCFTNGTATITIMVPIIYAVCESQKRPVSKFMQPITLMSMVWAGCIPTGGNAAGYIGWNTMIENLGGVGAFEYFTLMTAKLPIVSVAAIVTILFMPKWMPAFEAEYATSATTMKGAPKDTELSPRQEKLAYLIFIATIAGIVFCALTKGDTNNPACVGALAMVLFGVLTPKQARSAIQLPVIFIFAGMLPLSTALAKVGGDVVIADAIMKLLGGTNNTYVILGIFFVITSILTQFMSNTAVAEIFRPLAVMIAVQNGWNPIALMLAVTIGANCAMCTPMASPCLAVGYAAGKYDMKQYVRGGLPIWLTIFIAFMVWVPFIYPIA